MSEEKINKLIALDLLQTTGDGGFDDFQALKTLASIEKWSDDPRDPFVYAAKVQIRYIRAAFKLIQSGKQPWVGFGNNMRGAKKVAELLMKRDEARVGDAMVDEYLNTISGSVATLKTKHETRVTTAVDFN